VTAGLQKAFIKSFLKIPQKVVDKLATKEYLHETPQDTAESEKLFFWFIDK